MQTNKKCKYGRTWTNKDCELCTKYGKCELTERRKDGSNKKVFEVRTRAKSFVVFASKREGYKDNVVLRCNVRECSIRKNTTVYYLTKEKVVLGKRDIKPFIDCFSCENANIDTGYRGMQTDIYPVFTTKEKCIEWLKG